MSFFFFFFSLFWVGEYIPVSGPGGSLREILQILWNLFLVASMRFSPFVPYHNSAGQTEVKKSVSNDLC